MGREGKGEVEGIKGGRAVKDKGGQMIYMQNKSPKLYHDEDEEEEKPEKEEKQQCKTKINDLTGTRRKEEKRSNTPERKGRRPGTEKGRDREEKKKYRE
jgi:hypothetical protein